MSQVILTPNFHSVNKTQVILTPSFHPAKGITPITHTVVQHIDKVAKNPMMMFMVVSVRMGKARQTPMTIPIIALSARV